MSIAIEAPVARPSTGIADRIAKFVLKMQEARMRSVLDQMTDAQLEAIGTSRSDLSARAAELVRS